MWDYGVGKYFFGAVMCALAILSLMVASNAHGGFFHWAGLVFFGVCVLFVFTLIGRYVGNDSEA